MSKVVQTVLWIAGALLTLVVILPGVAGYGYALVMLPAYDQSASCKDRKADPIREDDFRVYLLNRGCNVEEAMETIGKNVNIDPRQLMSFYREAGPSVPDPRWDAAQDLLKSLKSFSGTSSCPPDCGASGFFGAGDPVSRLLDTALVKYVEIAIPIFIGTLCIGASHLVAIIQQGPLAQGLLYIAYAIGLAIAASGLYDLLKSALK